MLHVLAWNQVDEVVSVLCDVAGCGGIDDFDFERFGFGIDDEELKMLLP